MEFYSRRFTQELAQGPPFLPLNCLKPDIRSGFSLEAPPLKGSQDCLNLDQFSANGLFLSNFDPFGALASGSSSNDTGGGAKTFVVDCGDGVMENFQTGGERMEQDHQTQGMSFYNAVEPVNFTLPDEISCVTGDNGFYGDVGMNNKKSMQMKRSGKIQKKADVVKGQWTNEEDRVLVHLVEQFGLRKWSQIAKMLNGRMGKQCRERWHNHLRPNIKKDVWTEDEDLVIIQAHAEIGNKWAEIAKRLPGRTENSIKNRWNATKRRQFSRRKCRSSKYPKPSSLLQDYIRSLQTSSSSKGPTGRTQNKNTNASTSSTIEAAAAAAAPAQSGNSDCDRLVPNYCDFNDVVMDFPIDVDMAPVGSVFDRMMMMSSADMVDEKCMDMDMALDMESLMQCENVKKEMDLVEMISQSNNNSNKFF